MHALCAVVCILALVIISGCTSTLHDSSMNRTTIASSDPETGIQAWVDAVNNKDLDNFTLFRPMRLRLKCRGKISWRACCSRCGTRCTSPSRPTAPTRARSSPTT